MIELRKPATSGKSARLAAQRKLWIAAKTVPTAEVPAVDDPSLFSLDAEAKKFAARVDSVLKNEMARLESVMPSIEATEPKPKAAVGPPGAQGLPGQQKNGMARLESVTPSIEATEPKPKAAVGPPGAQGLPGQQGINGTGLPWVSLTEAEFEALAVKDPNTIYDITDIMP